jgi:hypothetical protein
MTRRTKISSQVGWSGIIIGISGGAVAIANHRGQFPAATPGMYDRYMTIFELYATPGVVISSPLRAIAGGSFEHEVIC